MANMISSFLHPEDAYKKQNQRVEEGWNEAKRFQMPYLNAGNDQIGKLTGAQDQLMDPEALQNKWSSGYEMSPYAQQLQQQAQGAGLDAASSQGLLGSSASLNNIQQGASNIMQKDRQNYMNDLMEKYMKGIGIGQDVFKTGAATAGNLGEQALKVGGDLGEGAYHQANAPGELFKKFANMALRIALAR